MKYLYVIPLIIVILSCSNITEIPEYKYNIYPQKNLQNAESYFVDGDYRKGPKVVLFIHGWTGSPSHFRELAEIMNKRGWTVYSIRLTGHGTSLYDMEKATYKDWIKDAEDGFNKLKDRYVKISVVGLSMGGSLALYLASKYNVYKVVCIAPALIPKNKFAYFVPVLRPFLSRFRFREDRVIKDGEAFNYLHDYLGYPTKTVTDMVKIGDLAKKNLKKVKCPVLIIQSKIDEAVDRKVPELIIKKVFSEKKRIFWLEESRHVSTTDTERYILAEEVINFLN